MLRLHGSIGIGHVRYPTAGCSSRDEAQPFYVNSPYGICLGHNGNLTNAEDLAGTVVRGDRRHLNTSSDTEVLLNVFAHELAQRGNDEPTAAAVFDAVSALHGRVRGGYAVVAMIRQSKSPAEAKDRLMEAFALSPIQAQAIPAILDRRDVLLDLGRRAVGQEILLVDRAPKGEAVPKAGL